MKKFFYLMALLAVPALTFIACGDDDDDNNNGNNTPITLVNPPYQDDAVKLDLKIPTEVPLNGHNVRLKRLELTESGQYLLTYTEQEIVTSRTRGDDLIESLQYLMGIFTKNADGSFTLTGFGDIHIEMFGNGILLHIYPNGQSGLDGIEVECTMLDPVPASELTSYLCRTWTIEKTQLRGVINGVSVGKEWSGKCNMNEVVEYAKGKGATITDNPKPNTIINGVTFTYAGSYLIGYANGTYDVGTWRWTNQLTGYGSLNYAWDSPLMGSSMESGKATVSFVEGTKCKLTLEANIPNSTVELIYTMH